MSDALVESTLRRVDSVRAAAGEGAHLMAYAVGGIQRLVFMSDRQGGIRAASKLVRDFDKWVMDESIPRRLGTVLAAGGRGLLLVPRDQGARVEGELRGKFEKLIHDAPLSVVSVPFDPNNEEKSLRWLWAVADARKDDAPPRSTAVPTSTGADLCMSCHRRDGAVDASRYVRDAAGMRVCDICQYLFKIDEQNRRSDQGNYDLASVAHDGRLAVVSADGNRMGQFFQSRSSLQSLAVASAVVSDVFTNAMSEACKVVRDDRIVAPLTGGDDIRAFLDPRDLEAFVGTLSSSLHSLIDQWASKTDPGLAKVGIGVGVVVAPTRFPALRLLDHAHQMEDRAKSYGRSMAWRSMAEIDVLVSGNELSEPRDRGAEPSVELPDGWRALMKRARMLAQVSSSQRTSIRDAARRLVSERREFENFFRYQVARHQKWQDYFESTGVNWRNATEVSTNIPSERLHALADLFKTPETSASPRPAEQT